MMYSVEWVPANDRWDCWNQRALTRWRWTAMLHLWELKMHLRKSGNHTRTRIRRIDDSNYNRN
jgi:hypothetical protein